MTITRPPTACHAAPRRRAPVVMALPAAALELEDLITAVNDRLDHEADEARRARLQRGRLRLERELAALLTA